MSIKEKSLNELEQMSYTDIAYEILKEDNDENDYCQHKRISIYKRDEYYKKNLIRIKLFYGIDKK